MRENSFMSPRKERILNELKDIIRDVGGLERDKITDQATFLELGFDSLFLALMSSSFEKKFKVDVTFRQLLEEVPTPDALARYIESHLPAEEVPTSAPQAKATATRPSAAAEPPPQMPEPVFVGPALVESSNGDEVPSSVHSFESIMSQQLQLMAKQLEVLRYYQTSGTVRPGSVPRYQGNSRSPESSGNGLKPESAEPELASLYSRDKNPAEARPVGPWKPIDKSDSRSLDSRQRKYLDELILRYTTRTQKSKQLTAAHRPHLADPRAVSGFHTDWKEMVYPIVSVRSSGSKVWDVDGNEYVDMLMGFGPALFGHSPNFIVRALEEQIKSGIEIGPQSPFAGKVAQLVCDFTAMERVTFCNTGSEAVLAALRVARTVTGRSKIALFSGSYHGIFDEVLVRPITTQEGYRATPAAPGIPPHTVQDVLVLRYGDPDSLNLVKRHADELAAVLVEPVQSRNPDLQPKEFLQALRELTAQSGIALIFDEIITGFRLHPGGAQAWFGVQADLATYGKALGGGMPIGVLAGKTRFMDALDGGAWNYGDRSIPEARVTYFAGTFVRHPLAIAAASAVLGYLKQAGSQLHQALNERASRLAKELNQFFERSGVAIHLGQCGSLFYLSFLKETRFSSLLFFYLREKGVHIWEGRPIFISTAHTDEDLTFVAHAIRESVKEMQDGGFLPRPAHGRTPTQPGPSDSSELKAAIPLDGSCMEPSSTSITPSKEAGEFPLTEAQMEIWLAGQLGNDACRAFNENILLRFKGALDVAAMRAAIQSIVDRHEALRTTFGRDGSFQRVNPRSAIDIPLIDLFQSDKDNKKARLEDLIMREVQQPFDLINGPLVRASVLRLEPEEYCLLITAHHLVCDGWSIHVLLSDLSALYQPAGNSKAVNLSKPTPLRDYAAWQLEQQSSPVGLATERYWLDRFSGPLPSLKLPTDRPRPPFRTFNGSCERVTIEKALHSGMKQLGVSQGCTAFTTFLAVFKILLHRLAAQEEIVVGIALAGQSMIGIDTLVGHCVNTLPLRDRIDSNQSFTEFLKSVNRSFLDAYEHQNYTFGSLVRKLNPSRDPSQTPLISAMFNMDQELQGLSFAGLDFELRPDPNPYVNFELSVNLSEKQGSLILECEYNSDLFDATTIRRWIGHYENLLREVLANPNQPISSLSLLSAAERHQLLIEWNRTERPYPRDKCIHQLFEVQAEQTPDAVAVVFEDQRLTYRELNQRANQLAHHLQNLGVGPEVLVGICVERSLEMMIGLFAIWKAGGAYLPLDPAYPKDRLAVIIEDSQVSVLLTQGQLLDQCSGHKAQVVCLDKAREHLFKESASNPVSGVTSQNLAYIIYTSGTTGIPKGVMIEHKSLVNYLWWLNESPLVKKTDNIPLITRLTFDASLKQLFLPLLQSRQVWILSNDLTNGPADFLKTLSTRVRVGLNCVPTLWSTLLDAIDSNRAITSTGFLSSLFLGGEQLDKSLIDRTLDAFPDVEIWNLYGPTEATANAIVGKISRGPISLGRPIANTQIYILDSHLQPAPVGIPGELHIGGAGLARCYLNRPELTNEKFIPNPFSPEPGARLYKTGDLARYRPDGTIEFLGRIDRQVKIRGFRIELGEIEAALGQHPAVGETFVTARQDVSSDTRLVAYMVPKKEQSLTIDHLRRFLRERLPQYMMPSDFVVLDALPLMPNGKIDAAALAKPERVRRELETDCVSPRTEVEEIMAEIWRDVLGLEQIGMHDNFFDLGGHSLLGIQLISRLCERFNTELPVRFLFQFPTVGELAAQVAKRNKIDVRKHPNEPTPKSFLFEFQPGSTGQAVFFLPGGLGGDDEFLVYARMAHYVGPHYAFYGLRARSADGTKPVHRRVEEMAADYIDEIRAVQPESPYFLVGECIGGVVAYEIARQLEAKGQKIALLALMDTDRPNMFNYLRYRAARLLPTRWQDHYYVQRVRFHWEQILRLDRRDILSYVLSKGSTALSDVSHFDVRKRFASRTRDHERSQRMRKLQEAYAETLRRYRPQPYQGAITILINEASYKHDPSLGWSELAAGGIDTYIARGDHQSYIRDHVQAVTLQLKACLEKAEEEIGESRPAIDNRHAIVLTACNNISTTALSKESPPLRRKTAGASLSLET